MMEDKYRVAEYRQALEEAKYAKSMIRYNMAAVQRLIKLSSEFDIDRLVEELRAANYSKQYMHCQVKAVNRYIKWLRDGIQPVKERKHSAGMERPLCTRACKYVGGLGRCEYKLGIELERRLVPKSCRFCEPMEIAGAPEKKKPELMLSEDGYEVIYRDNHSIMYGRKSLAMY